MDCDRSSCVITFGVSNRSDGELPLIYDISLSQNYVRNPNRSGLVAVGVTEGDILLLPNESKTIEVDIEVSETPNGLKVRVFDRRTPRFVVELLDIDPI